MRRGRISHGDLGTRGGTDDVALNLVGLGESVATGRVPNVDREVVPLKGCTSLVNSIDFDRFACGAVVAAPKGRVANGTDLGAEVGRNDTTNRTD